MTLAALWHNFVAWVMGYDRDGEQVEGNSPETVQHRARRAQAIAERHEQDRRAGRKAPKPYDPYRQKLRRPRVRLVMVGGPFFEPIETGGYSMEDYPYRTSGKQLLKAVENAAIVVHRRLELYDEAVLVRRAERERRQIIRAREQAEADYEKAIAKEQADARGKET